MAAIDITSADDTRWVLAAMLSLEFYGNFEDLSLTDQRIVLTVARQLKRSHLVAEIGWL